MQVNSSLAITNNIIGTFNSALHNKKTLVLPQLSSLLPYAMRATHPRPDLIREVQMGPFKHKVDDGAGIRRAAYGVLYDLLESPGSRDHIDMPQFYDRIQAGISDELEIRTLCCLVLSKLLVIAPAETRMRLESLAAEFKKVLGTKLKDTAVKQELEKLAEGQKAVVKASVAINRAFGPDENRAWRDYWDYVRKEFSGMVKTEEGSSKTV